MIKDNIKKTGVFNLILIALMVVYDSVRLFTGHSTMAKVTIIIHFVGFAAALVYTISGYKKDAAKYFKIYMFTLSICEIMSLVSLTSRTEPSVLSYVLRGICVINALMLTFAKDLGRKKSITICSAILLFHLYNLIHTLINATSKFQAVTNTLSDIILVILALVFIVAKYEDKESRGSK